MIEQPTFAPAPVVKLPRLKRASPSSTLPKPEPGAFTNAHRPTAPQELAERARRYRGDWSCYRWQLYGLAHSLALPDADLWGQLQVVAAIFQHQTSTAFLALPGTGRDAMFKWLAELGSSA